MIPQYVSKSLAAASSTGIGTLSSAGVATLSAAALDTQRRILIWGSSNSSTSATITIIGTRQGGTPVRETVTGPTSNGTVSTTQDFLTVTSVATSSAIALVNFGTSSVGGTPWQPVNTHVTPCQIGCNVTFSSTAPAMSVTMEMTMDDPTTAFYGGGGGGGGQVPGGTVAPGGQQIPFNVPPAVITSPGFNAVTVNTFNALNITSSATAAPGFQVPIWGWRMTLTSSSTAATLPTANAAVIQAGIG